jgi:hypothetical protein
MQVIGNDPESFFPQLPRCDSRKRGRSLQFVTRLRRAGGTDRAEQVIAALLAVAARLGADAAVNLPGGVLLAFVGAGGTGHDAGMQRRVDEIPVGFGLPHEEALGGRTKIGAIQGGADAAPELFHAVSFRQARIGAGGADLRGGGQREQRLLVAARVLAVTVRVAAEHRINRFHTGEGDGLRPDPSPATRRRASGGSGSGAGCFPAGPPEEAG